MQGAVSGHGTITPSAEEAEAQRGQGTWAKSSSMTLSHCLPNARAATVPDTPMRRKVCVCLSMRSALSSKLDYKYNPHLSWIFACRVCTFCNNTKDFAHNNKNWHLYKYYCGPGPDQGTLCTFLHSIPSTILKGRYYHYLYFTDGGAAKRDKEPGPRSHSWNQHMPRPCS